MKIGIEVEGRLRGVKTLFVSAEDIILFSTDELEKGLDVMLNYNSLDTINAVMKENSVSHIYISDRDNKIPYKLLSYFKCLVTLDVTKVLNQSRPPNVTIIWTLPTEFWASMAALGAEDQVKFHSNNRDVLTATKHHFIRTHPVEFAGDLEV